MINIYVKFLICFLKPQPPPKKEPKGKKPNKTPEKKGKENKPSDNEEPKPEPVVTDENVNCEENARDWCHIEYSLLEDVLPKVEISVMTWGEAAKVSMEGDCRSIKTALVDDLVWINFEVHHKINILTAEDVVTFRDTKIKFTFSQDEKKMKPSTSSDWPKKFTFCEGFKNSTEVEVPSDGHPQWFTELRQIDPPDEKYDSFSQKLDTFRISRPINKSMVSLIYVKPCGKDLESKMQSISATLPAAEPPVEPPKKGKGKKSNVKGKNAEKKGKGDQVKEDKCQLFVDAGLLISGTYEARAEQTDMTQSLRYAGVFVSSSKVLTDEQDVTYVPLIVNIQAFESLPVVALQEHNVSKVFARYEFAEVLSETETQKIPPEENIDFNETRVFFLSNPEEEEIYETLMQRPSMMRLAEALLTRYFVVKLYGETVAEEKTIEPCIFGDRPTDPFISTPDHEMFVNYTPGGTPSSTEVFIGCAYFNLIRLIKGFNVVESSSVLTFSSLTSRDPNCDFVENKDDSENDENRKTLQARFVTSGIIPESVFIELNTSVKLKVNTTCRLYVPEDQVLVKTPNIYHRAIVVLRGNSYNEKIVDLVGRTNNTLKDPQNEVRGRSRDSGSRIASSVQFVRHDSSTSRVSFLSSRLSAGLKLNLTLREITKIKEVRRETCNGFFIEHDDESILVFEAMTYIIPPLLSQILSLMENEHCARIICDSSIFFTTRLYSEFSPSNIFRIPLPVPLNSLLQNPSHYTNQNDEALRTLLQLDLLRRCRTLNSASINQLFPSYSQLISFHKVFGVQESDFKSINAQSQD